MRIVSVFVAGSHGGRVATYIHPLACGCQTELHSHPRSQPIAGGGGSNKQQKSVVNKKAKGKKGDDSDDDEVSYGCWMGARIRKG